MLALLLLTSCGSATGEGPGADGELGAKSQLDAADLNGRTFLSTDVSEDGETRPMPEGARVRLTFEDGHLSGWAGCNTMSGAYTIEDGQLQVPMMAMTEMGCLGPLAEVDPWLSGLLSASPELSLDGDELTLTAGTTIISLLDRVVADPDRQLVGTTWTVDSLISADAVSTTPGGLEATLSFGADGRVVVFAGCNRGSTDFEYDEAAGVLRIGALPLTRMACPGAGDELESAVLQVITAAELEVDITAAQLILRAGEYGLGLRAEE